MLGETRKLWDGLIFSSVEGSPSNALSAIRRSWQWPNAEAEVFHVSINHYALLFSWPILEQRITVFHSASLHSRTMEP